MILLPVFFLAGDLVELGVADYDGFSWNLMVDYNNSMRQGMTQQLSVKSKRNNMDVESSESHPVSYSFESSDESVLTVDETGLLTAVGEGDAEITVTLDQNPNVTQTVLIHVPAAENAYVAFTSTLPATMHETDAITVSAAYYENGVAQFDTVEFTFSGPEDGAFTVAQLNENTYRVTSYHASQKPLTVTAAYGGYSATAEIYLVT